jgi:EAL domain-containing protein (putative c-di-GMP-specific phosphodiesterase class I)
VGVSGIPTYRDVYADIARMLGEQGGLGALVIDLHPLARVERQFGGTTYQAVREQIDSLVLELKDRFEGDLLTLDQREGDRFILFLGKKRQGGPFVAVELRKLADRVEDFITPRVARLTLPYLREKTMIGVGYGFVLHSPLEGEERQISRLLEDALDSAELRRRLRERDEREALLEIIYNRKIWTAFQPIMNIESSTVAGHEGLSRGPRGSDLESPTSLFTAAARHGVVEELERACRRQGFVDWLAYGAPGRLFLNTIPSTVRDTSFLGRGVLDYLGPNLSPQMVTLEITEHQVIENMNLYREAMHPLLALGFTFAIDDLGAGYSGLETLATLGASFLKIDMGLVRGVHHKRVSQQVVKAIVEMGAGVGATVIAEGIETADEMKALLGLGVRFGQGFHLGRPVDPYAPASVAAGARRAKP